MILLFAADSITHRRKTDIGKYLCNILCVCSFFSVSVAVLFAESYVLFPMYFIYLEAAFDTCFAGCLAVCLIYSG